MKNLADKLTPLAVMVLALLHEDDMHPYEMIRLMRHRHDDRLVSITNGTLYHTVSRLERWGLVAEVRVDRDGNRPERTTYTVTDDGREAVSEWVRRELAATDRPMQFRVALAEAHNLDLEEALSLLVRRRAALAADLEVHRDGLGKSRSKGVPEVYTLEVEHHAAVLAADLAWLDDLIARLERGDIDWDGDKSAPSDRYLAQREAART